MAQNQNQNCPNTVLTPPFPRPASPGALEALYKSERYDAIRYKEELRLLLERDLQEKRLDAVKTVVLDDPPQIRSFKILLEIEDELKKKEEFESHNRKEMVFISSSSPKDHSDASVGFWLPCSATE
ncbi:hypothetical protein M9H77_26267 [Catharanthus roseus]|uniref:Uncharacterized protein n=1 Tax=Catharanthus roseus TaxID=4058 RepID=A0ACC0A9I2_CATRO|nr:hypothetical protein M9H77_26267 [Catharanthus roseus]